MRTIHILSLLITLLYISAAPATATTLASATTIVVLGDSLSAAYGIDEDRGWVRLLQEKLRAELPSVAVINASISGETSAGGKSRLPALLQQFKPDVVILELGGNDGLRGFPVAALRKNLIDMVTTSRAANARVLLLGIQIPPNYGPRYSKMFRDVYPQLADKYKLPLVPFFLQDVATRPELMQADGIHPTADAQPQLLANVWSQLQRLLDNPHVSHNQLQ